jgi:uncharacterized integral membrane protein
MRDEPSSEPESPPVEEQPEERPDKGEGRIRQWQPRLYLTIVMLGLMIAYGIAFVLENRKQVSLHFVFATARVSLIWLILLSNALGLLFGVLLSQLYRRRRRRH